jgi:Leucine-rich repeat (LRR) protein
MFYRFWIFLSFLASIMGCGSHPPEGWQDFTFDREIMKLFFEVNHLPLDSMDTFVSFWYNRAQSIKLKGRELSGLTFPDTMGYLESLGSISIIQCGLDSIPNSLLKISQVSALDFGANAIKVFPDWLYGMEHLRSLSLWDNHLESLPINIARFYKLTYLDLSNNQLSVLPSSFSGLTNLTYLSLHNNQLRVFPLEVLSLANLEKLHLSRNGFDSIPREISGLKKLTLLYLENNELTALPPGIDSLPIHKPELPSAYSSLPFYYLGLSGNRLCSLSQEEITWATTLQKGNWLATQRCD